MSCTPSRLSRIARGDEGRDYEIRAAVNERRSVGRGYSAARRLQDRVTGRDVPVPRRREARIKVRRTLGEATELYRRARLHMLGPRKAGKIGARALFHMRAADQHDEVALGTRTGMDRTG